MMINTRQTWYHLITSWINTLINYRNNHVYGRCDESQNYYRWIYNETRVARMERDQKKTKICITKVERDFLIESNLATRRFLSRRWLRFMIRSLDGITLAEHVKTLGWFNLAGPLHEEAKNISLKPWWKTFSSDFNAI